MGDQEKTGSENTGSEREKMFVLMPQGEDCGKTIGGCIVFAIFIILLIVLIVCLVKHSDEQRGAYEYDCGCEGMTSDYECGVEHLDEVVDAAVTSTEADVPDAPVETTCGSSNEYVYSADWSNQLSDQITTSRMQKNHKDWVKDLDGRYGGPITVDDMDEAIKASIPRVGIAGFGRTAVLKNRGIMAQQQEIDGRILPSSNENDKLAGLIGL